MSEIDAKDVDVNETSLMASCDDFMRKGRSDVANFWLAAGGGGFGGVVVFPALRPRVARSAQ